MLWIWRLLKFLAVCWTVPNTALGVAIGGVGLLSGGRFQFREGCLEFWGGSTSAFLRALPIRPIAMTLGHTVLGLDRECLREVSAHERIHVQQYERWGPLFLPAYGLASVWVWFRGGNAYRDNPFEVEAYSKAP